MSRKPAHPHFRPPKISSGTYPVARPKVPVAGEDYPRDSSELLQLFGTEAACQTAVEKLRWPRGYVCPQCSARTTPFTAGRLLGCSQCGHIGAVTAQTVLRGTLLPLTRWFQGFWEVTSTESGTNPHALERAMDLPDPRSAWDCLARMRNAMASASQEPLRGEVEVARSHVEIMGDRGTYAEPVMVAVAVQRCGGQMARVRLRVLPVMTVASMVDFVRDTVAPGSVVRTGAWTGYAPLREAGYGHQVSLRKREDGGSDAELRDAQHIMDVLRLWLFGTRVVTRARLEHYLDEFVFRFERRRCSHGLLFYHLLRAAIPVEREAGAQAEPGAVRSAAG
jgi:hypothetical protein